MKAENSVTLRGQVIRPVSVRNFEGTGGGGSVVANFQMQCDMSYTTRGERVEKTCLFDVALWGDGAEHLSNMSASAKLWVIVTGRLEQDRWENEHGERRSVMRVRAEDVGVSVVRPPERFENTEAF